MLNKMSGRRFTKFLCRAAACAHGLQAPGTRAIQATLCLRQTSFIVPQYTSTSCHPAQGMPASYLECIMQRLPHMYNVPTATMLLPCIGVLSGNNNGCTKCAGEFASRRHASTGGSKEDDALPAAMAPAMDVSGAAPADETPSTSRQRNMVMVFTCTKCDTRAAKAFSRHSYERGIVIVRCPGCDSNHLVADNLGWFGDKSFNIEQLTGVRNLGAAQPGQLSAGDLLGWSRVQAVQQAVAASQQTVAEQKTELTAEEAAVAQFSEGVVQVSAEDAARWAAAAGEGGAKRGTGGSR